MQMWASILKLTILPDTKQNNALANGVRVSRVEFTKLYLWIVPSIRSAYRQVVLRTYTKQRPRSSKMCNIGTVELPISGRWLSRSPIIRIGLDLRVNLSRVLQNELALQLPVIGSSKYGVMACRTSNQACRKVWTQEHIVNSNTRISNCQCSLFSKNNEIIRIFRIFGWSAVAVNPDKLSSTASAIMPNITSINKLRNIQYIRTLVKFCSHNPV